jgi:hypothetical protein
MNSKYEFSQDAIDNFMFIHAYWKNSCDGINAAPENKWGYKRGDIPFIDYLCEDKSKYPKASGGISYITNKPLYDPDNDFLIGNSGGILMNIDFIVINIERLSKAADTFDEYGTYCDYDPSTPAYESFWQRETSRRKKGVFIKAKLYYKDIPKFFDANTTDEERESLLQPLRITGAHYTYLNYGRIERTPNDKERARLKREGAEHVETVMGFPRYWDGDYWNFKIDEFIANNKFHLTKAKARRKGFSYKRGSQAANTINLFPNVTVTLAADQLAYLTDKGATTFMAKKCLDHFEEHTFWRRGYISEVIDDILLGYRVSTKGLKNFGWMSNLYSVAIGKNESAAVGKKAIEIDFEEAGKCVAKGTRFIMFDGSIKNVEDIVAGDVLMGPDSKPRTVLATTHGVDNMYKVIPENGIEHIVNSKHPIRTIYRKAYGNIVREELITAPNHIKTLSLHPRWRECYALEKVNGIEFEHKDVLIDPYIFGLWIGDGDKDSARFTNPDIEVIDALKEFANANNLVCNIYNHSTSKLAKRISFTKKDCSLNWFRQALDAMGVKDNKFIPKNYICTDRESRLQFLAGIIDTDGNYDARKHNFEIIQKLESVTAGIVYIARSLGIKTTVKTKVVNGCTYYRIFLLSKGWIIPTKVKRKQCPEYTALQKNPLECRFDIESIGKDEYYGFEVDGDSLCLLEDFTIFHNCPNLQKALDVTLSNTESGAISVGTIRVYGTGGTKGANWAAFSKAFYNPKMNKMLCMENVWDINKRHEVCGFFFPQVWDCEPYVERGNSIIFTAYAWDKQDKENHFHNNDNETHIIYKAQRANTPAEAFINTTENMFASPELNLHVSDLINDDATRFFQDGWIVVNDLGNSNKAEFIPKAECIKRDIFGKGRFHEFVNQVPHGSRDDTHGCVRMYYRPFLVNGEVPKDLYFVSVDAYKVDKAQKDVTDKHSLYSAQVWMRSNTITPYPNQKLLVCEYIGRLDTMEQNDIVTMGMCLMYNAECCPEAGTGETVSNFIKYKLRRYLMLDPTNANTRKLTNPNNNDYGIVIGDSDKKYNGLRMLKEFIYEPLSYTADGKPIRRLKSISSVRLLLECQRFTAEGNFDHISAAIVAMYVFLADSLNTKRLVEGNTENNDRRIANRLNRR